MCCLWGLFSYRHQLSLAKRQQILRVLSIAAEDRGTDATGIAYLKGDRFYVQKAPRPAHRMRFRLSSNAHIVTGHSRLTTQGDGRKRNFNNHPFEGIAGNTRFVLAHNGIIHNDKELQSTYHLPPTQIETDSYVAVQLLEQAGEISFQSLAKMAETVQGSFTFTVLDVHNNLYIVKGNSPMCIYHFERMGFYLYASTEEILDRALTALGLDREAHKKISLTSGEILCIAADGSRSYACFRDDHLWSISPCYGLYTPSLLWDWEADGTEFPADDEDDILTDYSAISGVDRDTLHFLRSAGFGWLEIEEMLYEDPEWLDSFVTEMKGDTVE